MPACPGSFPFWISAFVCKCSVRCACKCPVLTGEELIIGCMHTRFNKLTVFPCDRCSYTYIFVSRCSKKRFIWYHTQKIVWLIVWKLIHLRHPNVAAWGPRSCINVSSLLLLLFLLSPCPSSDICLVDPRTWSSLASGCCVSQDETTVAVCWCMSH